MHMSLRKILSKAQITEPLDRQAYTAGEPSQSYVTTISISPNLGLFCIATTHEIRDATTISILPNIGLFCTTTHEIRDATPLS